MDKNQTEKYQLTIKTNDIASENFVIDGKFNRVAKSIGDKSSFMLPKGLYSVKVMVGNEFRETPVTLTENKNIEFEPIVFNTPAPLSGTYDTSDFQIFTASNYSKKDNADVALGKGSKLFLFGSIPSESSTSDLPEKDTDPAVGLTLRTFNDEVLIDFGAPDIGTYSWEGEPWAACDIDIDPGNYVLCVEANENKKYRQAIVTSAGWQTQIFLQPRNYGIKEKEVRADLVNGSILMARVEHGFNPSDSANFKDGIDYRLTEQIRQALKTKRNVINSELLKVLLSGKIENPMLGIYAAHLLLQNSTASGFSKGEIIVENLRRLLGNTHPDVEAIALKMGMGTNYVFREFPMLANSWSFVLEASVNNPELIPQDSVAYKFSGQFWSNEFWLIWGNDSKSEYYQLKQDIVGLIQRETKPDSAEQSLNKQNLKTFSHAIRAVASNKRVKEKILSHLPFYKKALDNLMSNLNTDKIVQVTQSLGIPHQKVIDLIDQVNLNDITSAVKKFNLQYSTDTSDPQKGQWGKSNKNNFRKMTASVKATKIPGWFKVTINVVSTKKNLPLEGEVKFHLHDTFLNPTPSIAVQDGKATLELNSVWGAFTVGAEADDGKTKLELDLSELKKAPEDFKSQ